MGRGMIAYNTSALQQWWDGKQHHTHGSNALGRSLFNARVSGVFPSATCLMPGHLGFIA